MIRYYSTNSKNIEVSFKEAVIKGLAEDGGLFMSTSIPKMEDKFWKNLQNLSIDEIAVEVLREYVRENIPKGKLEEISKEVFNFDTVVKNLSDKFSVLELYHGPTLAFKDYGARFLARSLEYFAKDFNKKINILVATSGDTGSAVASGFYDIEGVDVYILYPSKRISEFQEKQLTTYGKNIKALEIEGSFDDCQKLVKKAFVDNDLNSKFVLSSANSINIARLLPQSIYYFEAYKKLSGRFDKINVTVPSGNLGNITAGLLAKRMGLPVNKFIAATNINSVFTEYIESGKFEPRKSIQTLSNAMDVGDPSNLARINVLYGDDIEFIRSDINAYSKNDEATKDAIKEVFDKYQYIMDPHGAVAYKAAIEYSEKKNDDLHNLLVETAHPAKFKSTIENVIDVDLEIPDRLKNFIKKEKASTIISSEYDEFKSYLMNNLK